MEEERIRKLLEEVQKGRLDVDAAFDQLRSLPYEDIAGFARIDNHRAIRQGFPEVIFGQGKTPDQVAQIFNHLSLKNDRVLATRVSPEMYAEIRHALPADAFYHTLSRLLILNRSAHNKLKDGIVVATGGTADLPVAEEAALTAELMGHAVIRMYDVGVAGLHRLLDQTNTLQKARVIVVVAGMEGALASVVAGLVSAPVVAVPTSIGYGANFHGLAALLTMVNSCATGVAVVNIDNGFGAGMLAAMINRLGYPDNPPASA